jgi:hypothetical protein
MNIEVTVAIRLRILFFWHMTLGAWLLMLEWTLCHQVHEYQCWSGHCVTRYMNTSVGVDIVSPGMQIPMPECPHIQQLTCQRSIRIHSSSDTVTYSKRPESSNFIKFVLSKFEINSCALSSLMFNSVKASITASQKMITLWVTNTSRENRLGLWMHNDTTITSREYRLGSWIYNDTSITSREYRLGSWIYNDTSITCREYRLGTWWYNDTTITSREYKLGPQIYNDTSITRRKYRLGTWMYNDTSISSREYWLGSWIYNDTTITSREYKLGSRIYNDTSITCREHRLGTRMYNNTTISSSKYRLGPQMYNDTSITCREYKLAPKWTYQSLPLLDNTECDCDNIKSNWCIWHTASLWILHM